MSDSQIDDLKQASRKMLGAARRAFQASMTQKYCSGNARQAERIFGWCRHTVELGLHERRTGIVCLGAQAAYCGNKLWEAKHPQAAASLLKWAESHAQQDPTFRTTLAYTRLTAAEALKYLKDQGFSKEQLPSLSTMAEALNRNGYRLRKVIKAKPQKKHQKPMPSLPISSKKAAKATAANRSNA